MDGNGSMSEHNFSDRCARVQLGQCTAVVLILRQIHMQSKHDKLECQTIEHEENCDIDGATKIVWPAAKRMDMQHEGKIESRRLGVHVCNNMLSCTHLAC